MSDNKKTHWKKLTNPDFLGSWDFSEGEERILTIKKITQGEVTGEGGKTDECVVAHFSSGLPMVLNATNMKAITLAYRSPNIEDWVGRTISVHVEKVKAFGDIWDALRVSTEAPKGGDVKGKAKAKPMLKKDSPEYDRVVSYLKDHSNKDFEGIFSDIENKYKVSSTLKGQLKLEHNGK